MLSRWGQTGQYFHIEQAEDCVVCRTIQAMRIKSCLFQALCIQLSDDWEERAYFDKQPDNERKIESAFVTVTKKRHFASIFNDEFIFNNKIPCF